jgi:hypothetical protein
VAGETPLRVEQRELNTWRDIVVAADYFVDPRNWVFRGQECAGWALKTSLERQFGTRGAAMERQLISRFVRAAGRHLPSHLVPDDDDAAAWLGLIQHYGGPTRLFEPPRVCRRAVDVS